MKQAQHKATHKRFFFTMAPLRSKQSAVISVAPPLAHNSEGPIYNKADGTIDHGVTQAPYERGFSPYEFNGGTTVAISGEDWAIVAADTRLSSGYEILSRNVRKLHPLPTCVSWEVRDARRMLISFDLFWTLT